MGNLVTLAAVKTYLQIGFATDDALLNDLIAGYSAAVEKYCTRSISGVIAQTDIMDGGYKEFVLKRRPVVSLTAVTDRIDSSVVDPSLYDLDPDAGMVLAGTPAYDATVGVLDLSAFSRSQPDGEPVWGFGRRRWQLDYTHGYATVPNDVQLAVKILVAGRYNRRDDLSSETVGDYNYHADTGDSSSWTPQVEQLLANYKEDAIS
ncbi:MAG: head-tail connector protein [Candidatus Binatus sp.]